MRLHTTHDSFAAAALCVAPLAGLATPAAAQDRVLEDTYNYARIAAEWSTPCAATLPILNQVLDVGTIDFDADGSFTVETTSWTVATGSTCNETDSFSGTYTLSKGGTLELDLGGGDVALLRTSWDDEVLILHRQDFDAAGIIGVFGEAELLVATRQHAGGAAVLSGDYARARVLQDTDGSGVQTTVARSGASFDGSGQVDLDQSFSVTLSSLGAAPIVLPATSDSYQVDPDGRLGIGAAPALGGTTPDGRFAFAVEQTSQTTSITLLVAEPTTAVTSVALDGTWWSTEYGADLEPSTPEVEPESTNGALGADGAAGSLVFTGVDVFANSLGGGEEAFGSVERFELDPDGRIRVLDAFAEVQLCRGEDLGLLTVIDDPDFVGLGLLVRDRGPLSADRGTIDATDGGVQRLTVRAGREHAGQSYWVVGSASGTMPGLPVGGELVPLVPDAYFLKTVNAPNAPPLGNSLGVLGPDGDAFATFTLAAGATGGLVGANLCHAVVVLDLFDPQPIQVISSPVPLEIVP